MLNDNEASFTLEIDTSGPGPLVRVHGDLDLESAPELTGVLKTLLGPHPVVVDLADVEFMDSSGLGVLVGAHKESIAHGGALVVVGPGPRIQKIFRITKLDKVFTVYSTLDDLTAVVAEQQIAEAAGESSAPSGTQQSNPPQPPALSQAPGLPSSPPASGSPQAPRLPGSSQPPASPQAPGLPGSSQAPTSQQAPGLPDSPRAEGPASGQERGRG